MRLSGRGIGWGLSLGLALLVGCSDDGASKSSGSGGQGTKPSTPPMPAAPVMPTSVTPAPSASPVKPEPVKETRSLEELVEAGRSTYNANCIACHGIDPTKDGVLGPAISGSSAELIETRVMRAEYPEGYTPKRQTKVMIALPHLKDRLPELAAYLDSVQ